MLHHRLCVIGLPRIGSQYAVELIKLNGLFPYYDLVEPFEPLKRIIYVDENNFIKLSNNETCNEEFRIKDAVQCLEHAHIEQALITRLFYVKEQQKHFDHIIKCLVKRNFDFIVLKRNNIEHHLLSFAMALETDIWAKWNRTITPNHKITLNRNHQMEWLYKRILEYYEKLESLDITYDLLNYETIETDLSKIMGFVINTSTPITKQADKDNPYNQIANADEVKQFIDKLIAR